MSKDPKVRRATGLRFARLFPGIPLVYNAIGGQNCIPIDFARVLWGSASSSSGRSRASC